MSNRVPDERIQRLEALAARFYPGHYTLVDEPIGDLLGKKGMRADIVASTSPGFSPANIAAIAMVFFGPVAVHPLPAAWGEVLEFSKDKPWKVELFVPRSDVAKVRGAVKGLGSRAEVVPLPHDSRSQLLTKSTRAAHHIW